MSLADWSENFTAKQRYALVLLSDGGIDLETFKFDSASGWVQAAGMFWQVADALARAEQWTKFEVSLCVIVYTADSLLFSTSTSLSLYRITA